MFEISKLKAIGRAEGAIVRRIAENRRLAASKRLINKAGGAARRIIFAAKQKRHRRLGRNINGCSFLGNLWPSSQTPLLRLGCCGLRNEAQKPAPF